MGRFELILLTLAIIMFSIFSSMALSHQVNARLNLVHGEIELSAYSQAEAILNQAWSKHFDEYTREHPDANLADIDTSNDFTPESNFGDEIEGTSIEHDIRKFNTLDDFGNGIEPKEYPEQEVKIENENGVEETFYRYKVFTRLAYVNGSPPTTQKNLTVYIHIIEPDIPGEEEVPLTMGNKQYHIEVSKTFTYYTGYHGLE